MLLHESYHETMLDPADIKVVVASVREYLRQNPDVVAIAGVGMSGVPLVAILTYETGLKPIYIRSLNSEQHDYKEIVTSFSGIAAGRYVIIDDFFVSGATIRRVADIIRKTCIFGQGPKAILLTWPKDDNQKAKISIGDEVVPSYHVGTNKTFNTFFKGTP